MFVQSECILQSRNQVAFRSAMTEVNQVFHPCCTNTDPSRHNTNIWTNSWMKEWRRRIQIIKHRQRSEYPSSIFIGERSTNSTTYRHQSYRSCLLLFVKTCGACTVWRFEWPMIREPTKNWRGYLKFDSKILTYTVLSRRWTAGSVSTSKWNGMVSWRT